MSRSLRRYEILLPLRFNDGESVPDDFVADTLLELEQHFGAVSSETQTIRGLWRHEGESYRDDLIRVFVDVADLPNHRQFFLEFKERLKSQFQQVDIWMMTYPIEVLRTRQMCLREQAMPRTVDAGLGEGCFMNTY